LIEGASLDFSSWETYAILGSVLLRDETIIAKLGFLSNRFFKL
jgi:hypothetical protein